MTGRRLTGRVAVVTGASRGLGKAIALAMAAEEAAVAVVARTEQQWNPRLPGTIGETVAEIESRGGRAVAIRADLHDRDDRGRLVDEVRSALGPITLLVNNAALTAPGRPPKEVGAPAPATTGREPSPSRDSNMQLAKAEWPTFLTTPSSAYERHFLIGPFAAYELMQLVAPDMVRVGYGSIINISSGASRSPGPGPYSDHDRPALAGYGGAKAALEHLTQCVAYELYQSNVAVNALIPSKAIRTPGVTYYSKVYADVASEEDFAEAAVRLATVDPKEVTGQLVGHQAVLNGSYRPYTR